MKTRLLLIALAVFLAAAMVGGTMAWFTAKAEADDAAFTAGTVMIRAGSSTTMEEPMNGEWVLENVYPEEVVSSEQGTLPTGGAVAAARSNPEVVLSLVPGTGPNFFSLGFFMDPPDQNPDSAEWSGRGGEIVVRFGEPISAFDDRLLLVVEDTHGSWPEELADVYVSQDNNNWTYVGTATNQIGTPQSFNYIPVPDIVEWFQYVKVIDITNPYNFEVNWKDWNNDAFDLHCIKVERWIRENWNPGDCDEVKYYVRNTGSKDIRVRATMIGGAWQFDWDWLWENWDALCFSEVERPDEMVGDDWDAFVAQVEGLENPVAFDSCNDSSDWFLDSDGYFYYTGSPVANGEEVEFCLKVCFDGELATNHFQGATYTLSVTFEAVQSSNYAPYYEWGTILYGAP